MASFCATPALGTSAMPFEQREHRLHEFDIVVCATSAPDVVVTLAATRAAMQRRPARPLLLIDQALPRDVDPGVSALENVFLYNLDDLARIAEELHDLLQILLRLIDTGDIFKCHLAGHLWEQFCLRLPKPCWAHATSTS